MDIALVNMPYFSLERPSLALGNLSAVLERGGLNNTVHYANLYFAQEIGLNDYVIISRSHTDVCLGEWTFSPKAFPDFRTDHDLLIHQHMKTYPQYYRGFEPRSFKERLVAIQTAASRFIDTMVPRILVDSPLIVGCSSTMQQHVPSLALLRHIKKIAPETVTILGGSNCEAVMGRTTHQAFPWIDFVVSGEAEELIIELVKGILEYGREVPKERLPSGVFAPAHRPDDYPKVPICHPDDAPRAQVNSLGDLPKPNFSHYFTTLDSIPLLKETVFPALPMETSRGCWWGQCTFCGLNGAKTKYRIKPSERVLDEMSKLSKRYGVTRFLMVDTILNPDFAKNVMPSLIRQGSPYEIFFEVRVNMDRQQVKQLSDAGIRWIQPGVESLHDESLALMRKGTRLWQNIQFLKWCRQYGIHAIWTLLYSFPEEKDVWFREMSRLIPMLAHLQPPVQLNNMRFDRYSHYWYNQQEYGLKLRPARFYSHVYPFSRDELQHLVWFFEDANHQHLPPPIDSDIARVMAFFMKQGFKQLAQAVNEWISAFESEERPALEITQVNTRLRIRDTRPISGTSSFELDALESQIYLACDAALPKEELIEGMQKQGATQNATEEAIHRLLERKLMFDDGERLLALATQTPCRPYERWGTFPFGWIEPDRDPTWKPVMKIASVVTPGGRVVPLKKDDEPVNGRYILSS